MTLPFDIPAWLPWWVPLVLLVPALLWILAFLLIPFSVIGVKSRLDGLEARLDDLQADIRTLSLRLPETVQSIDFDELYTAPDPTPQRRAPVISRPPIPPAPHELELPEEAPREPPQAGAQRGARATRRAPRTEPRLDWPR